VVEIYGSVHETSDQREYDYCRQEYLEANGYTMMICQANDVINDLSGVLLKILNMAASLKTPLRSAGERIGVR
jgi:very-short-patch-repair endonuclease